MRTEREREDETREEKIIKTHSGRLEGVKY